MSAPHANKHFIMDERGLGGTYMIQQQFLDMYRKIHTAKKTVDNEPPRANMFRRPYFSRFGDFYKRIPQSPVNQRAQAVVDTSAPVSYGSIANLYINQGAKKNQARKERIAKNLAKRREEKKQMEEDRLRKDPERLGDDGNDHRLSSRNQSSIADINFSLDRYQLEAANRQKEINSEIRNLQQRRMLRLKGIAPASPTGTSSSSRPGSGRASRPNSSQPLATTSSIAKAVIASIDQEEEKRIREYEEAVGAEAESETSIPAADFNQASGKGMILAPTPPSRNKSGGGRAKRESSGKTSTDFGPPLDQLIPPKKDVWKRKAATSPERKTRFVAATPGTTVSPGRSRGSPYALPSAPNASLVQPYDGDDDDEFQ